MSRQTLLPGYGVLNESTTGEFLVPGYGVLNETSAAAVDQTLSPSLVTNTNSFYSASISIDITLTAGLVTNTNTFYAARVDHLGSITASNMLVNLVTYA